ncbi:hypothetical protein SUGI_0559110 [Cryptomeria japonica]|nr:hypothetical protein SUGI_0559110 [Cryptomeria japonica]
MKAMLMMMMVLEFCVSASTGAVFGVFGSSRFPGQPASFTGSFRCCSSCVQGVWVMGGSSFSYRMEGVWEV